MSRLQEYDVVRVVKLLSPAQPLPCDAVRLSANVLPLVSYFTIGCTETPKRSLAITFTMEPAGTCSVWLQAGTWVLQFRDE